MKIVWTLLIGMLIFQSLFVAFAVFFTVPDTNIEGLENVTTDSTGMDLGKGGGWLWEAITGDIGTFVIGGLTGLAIIGFITVTKNYVAAAITMYIGFVSWLYLQTAGILVRMNNIGGRSPVGLAFIGLFGVVLAILVIKSIIEMLAPGGVE